MVILLIILTFIVTVSIEILIKKYKIHKEVEQEIFYHPAVGLTMADGGEKIGKKK